MELEEVVEAMEEEGEARDAPVLEFKHKLTTPFRRLVSVLLSSRTRDETTAGATGRLFHVADSPEEILKLSQEELARLIYPVGFYRVKARKLKKLAKVLLEKHGGEVPESFEELIELPGIGRKSANVFLAYLNKPFIGVDTHVHRISNRLGLVESSRPGETERELNRLVKNKLKPRLNRAFVAFGQTVCLPVKPLCSECPLAGDCPKIGVGASRV